jgi:hypothetical protein
MLPDGLTRLQLAQVVLAAVVERRPVLMVLIVVLVRPREHAYLPLSTPLEGAAAVQRMPVVQTVVLAAVVVAAVQFNPVALELRDKAMLVQQAQEPAVHFTRAVVVALVRLVALLSLGRTRVMAVAV